MNGQLIEEYLKGVGMEASQAEALSRILDQMVTKSDFRAEMASLRADLHALEAKLTWRFYTGLALMATVMTLLDLFID